MSSCELCGKSDDNLVSAIVEGTELRVCTGCSRFGKILRKPQKKVFVKTLKPKFSKQVEEPTEDLVDNFSSIIKKAREKLGLTQKEFAKKIFEKDSIIHNIEIGKMKPNLKLAKKLEKSLKITLIEVVKEEESEEKTPKSKNGVLTIGDMIKIKKK